MLNPVHARCNDSVETRFIQVKRICSILITGDQIRRPQIPCVELERFSVEDSKKDPAETNLHCRGEFECSSPRVEREFDDTEDLNSRTNLNCPKPTDSFLISSIFPILASRDLR